MDAAKQIQKVGEFFDLKRSDIEEAIRRKQNFVNVSFQEILAFDPDLAEEFLEKPDDMMQASELAIKQMEDVRKFYVRVGDLPEVATVKIKNVRSEHLGKFICLDGIVRQKSDVRPQMTLVKFECPACGNVHSITQTDEKYKEPQRCGCGFKGKFKELDKTLVDVQRIVLEENPEKLEGGEQPKRINLFLKEDLVSPISEKKTNPGSAIIISGVLKEVPVTSRAGAQTTRFDLVVEANHIKPKQTTFSDLKITEDEIERIKELSKDEQLIDKLVEAIAPSLYGHDLIKKAVLLQLFGGVHKKRSDGVITRGDMHILLIGDPGAGKSQLLKRGNVVAPKARYVSGKGASGAGLTASVVKDEFLGGWSLEAGALVLASDGLCCIDELDKMTSEDRSAMHEALEQQTISVSKANIQATLTCRTTVLAAANPKFGRFDPYQPIVTQIDLPPPLISRFDLIFPIRDLPDLETDDKKALHILSLHQNPTVEEPEVDTDLLRKYISYSKRVHPVLTDGAIDEIKRYYVDIRNKNSGEDGHKSVPITARQLEALVRMSEAFARMKLKESVTRKEAKEAVELLHSCLLQVGVDPETGKIDTDIISTGISSSQRGKIMQVKDIINALSAKFEDAIPMEEIIKACKEQDIDPETAESTIQKLKRAGDIFEPKPGKIQKL